MAMITCPECGKRISEYSTMCIGCGIPMEMIKKLLADTEPAAESATVQAEIKKKIVSCIICGTSYDIADQHCPNCNYPALSLSSRFDMSAAGVQEASKRLEQIEQQEQTAAEADEPETAEDAADLPFLMPIEDRFEIDGRGIVVTGLIERGTLKTGDAVEIIGLNYTKKKAVVTGIESYRKIIDQAGPGQGVGVLLKGVRRSDIERGQVIAEPGTAEAHIRFKAQIYILKKEEGGRNMPFFKGYRPQFYFRTTDVTGKISLPAGTEMSWPGTSETMVVQLVAPLAMEEGQHFVVREDGQTVAKGVVTEILQ